jgi:hypothetical protein
MRVFANRIHDLGVGRIHQNRTIVEKDRRQGRNLGAMLLDQPIGRRGSHLIEAEGDTVTGEQFPNFI